MCRAFRSKERSDSEYGQLRGQQTWRGVLIGKLEQSRSDGLDGMGEGCDPFHNNQGDATMRSSGCELRMIVGPNFRPAASRFRHLPARAVHGSAARTLFVIHRATRYTDHDGRCSRKQK